MKICLFGDFSGTPDEGMKNISKTVKTILSIRHGVLALNSREILQLNIVKQLKSFSPEIVHYLHGPTIRSLVMLKSLKLILGKKTKIVVSATRPYFSKYSRWSIPFLKPDLILTQSAKFETFFKDKGCKVDFMPNGVDCHKFFPITENEKIARRKAFGLPEDKKIILHVGHIKSNRQLEIFKKIQEINLIQVVIVGGTAQKSDNKLKTDLESSGIRVIHEYFDDISEIYKTADLYVFPIQDTGLNLPVTYNQVGAIDLPLSVLEAMACNLPVITTGFGALQRLFEPGAGLYYCDNEDQIIDQVKTFSYQDHCQTREKVLPYDWFNLIKSLEKKYKSIVTLT